MGEPFAYLNAVNALVVDRNPFARRLLTTTLHAFGCKRWTECSDGADALKALRHITPDIIFTEIEMAPLNGIEMIRFIREDSNPVVQLLPVVVVSAYSEAHRVFAARDVGANEFLVKPYSAAALLARIREVAEKPRQFVKVKGYFGPDRRRRHGLTPHVPRREADNHQEVLSQGAVDTVFAGGVVLEHDGQHPEVMQAQEEMNRQHHEESHREESRQQAGVAAESQTARVAGAAS